MSLKIHHTIVKSLAAASLVAVAHPTEAGMVSIQMEGVEIVAGPLDDVKALAAKAKGIVEAEDFDLDAHREEGDGEGSDEGEGDADGSDADRGDEEAAEGDETGSVVKPAYRKKYREIGQHDSNGDQIALAMRAAVTVANSPKEGSKAKASTTMSLTTLLAIAAENNLPEPKGANPGQRRMNLGNMLRGVLNKGLPITIGGTEIQPTEEAKAKAAARFEAEKARAEAAAAPKPTKEEQAAKRNAKAKARRAVRAAQKAEAKASEPATQAEGEQPQA